MRSSIFTSGSFSSYRLRRGLGQRATSIVLALVAEGLLVILLLTINPPTARKEKSELTVVTFAPAPAESPAAKQSPIHKPKHKAPPLQKPSPITPPVPEEKEDNELPLIPLSLAQMEDADIAAKPARAQASPEKREITGPVDKNPPRDSIRVSGTGPNGEPLYAAAWYRKPYDEELRGYLSTASGPGWGQIACRTVPDYRVDDCVAVGEYPQGSNIARAVLAAAWQFRVMPPRLGGRLKVGEWVQIRIDYDLRRR